MKKLLTLFILALSLLGFNSSIYAVQDGSQSTDQEQTATDKEKKKKKAEDEEEPECD